MMCEADVEADEVGQRQRPHRVVEAEPRARVDVLGGAEALLVAPASPPPRNGISIAVDDEPGPVRLSDDLLAQLGRDLADARLGGVGRRGATDQLDQRHHRHRAEEVHADEAGRRLSLTAAARRVIEIELVLLAKIAPAGAMRVELREERRS